MTISVVTPTADRPIAFALCERWLSRQTVQPSEWIVCDGGTIPAARAAGQVHLHSPRPPGAANFAHNLLAGIAAAKGDIVVIAEDDDWLAPTHIESLVAALDQPYAIIAGASEQIYYHVGRRCWRNMVNRNHASLGQTALRRGALGVFESVIQRALAAGKFSIDFDLWNAISTAQWARADPLTCVGIKGLPGTAGLGIGHRPAGLQWTLDLELEQLRAWIGEDADGYAGFKQ